MSKLRAAALSDIGRVRQNNEDRALLDLPFRLFGVADGVGGLPGGAEAAQAAHDSIFRAFQALPPAQEPNLTAIVEEANRSVAEMGRKISPASGIATTLTFGCVYRSSMRIAHLGDSRCYGWVDGQFSQLTQDHTVESEARRQRSRGEVMPYSPAERHAITRCLGFSFPPNPDFEVRPLQADDRYLFCTDGITGPVSNEEIASALRQPKEPAAILQELIALASRRGGVDNATGVLVIVDEP